MEKEKQIHVKPSLYAYYFYELKGIALKYGYNLALHGSLSRDLDLIAIPWTEDAYNHVGMIEEFASHIGGYVLGQTHEQINCKPHGRMVYIINVNRGGFTDQDPQYYLDISVMPTIQKQ